MLEEWADHARAVCRISVAEIRRLWPSAFAIFMVSSLLMADGLLPVMAARYRTELALYSSAGYTGAPASGKGGGGDSRGGDDDDGGGGGGRQGGGETGSRDTIGDFPKSDVRSHASVKEGHPAQQMHNRAKRGKISNAYNRNKMAFVSGSNEVVLESNWVRNDGKRTSSVNKFVDPSIVNTHHLKLQQKQSKHTGRGIKDSDRLGGDRRKIRHSSPKLHSDSADSSLYSLQSSSSSSSSFSSLASSASSLLSPKGPRSAPSIYDVSSLQNTVKSFPSKPSLKPESLPSSLPSSSSAFSTLSSSDPNSSSSSNRKTGSTKTFKNNHNGPSKSKNKYHLLFNHYKHQRQRLQGRGYDWASHRSLITPISHDLSIRQDITARNASSSQQNHSQYFNNNNNNHHHLDSNNNNSNKINRASSKHSITNTNTITRGLQSQDNHYFLMQGDEPLSEEDQDSPSTWYLQPQAPARYVRRSHSTPGNCAASNGTSSCDCHRLKHEVNLTLDSQLIDLVCGGLQSPDCLDVAQNTHMAFCSDYPMTSLSRFLPFASGGPPSEADRQECADSYRQALQQDRIAQEAYLGFHDLIGRYDCTQSYSVKWNCTHCKVISETSTALGTIESVLPHCDVRSAAYTTNSHIILTSGRPDLALNP
ncbi:hypothetical protein ElyMa_000590200 [Elysia marginata]|uniref:Uncharacterized protein n=1 Tax=Elysia marginata TaxID=1093978 RepID=A0AAV4G5T0_9GAST|nr:hypothetical protein ElyMa_000590200 [Elysia marginata]